MKIKKYIGAFILMMTAVVVNSNSASAFLVGAEEMPDSMKKLR